MKLRYSCFMCRLYFYLACLMLVSPLLPAAQTTTQTASAAQKPVTIVFTQGLGTFMNGVAGIDPARNEAVAKKLRDLRAKYNDAIFLDGGDGAGAFVLSESQFGLIVYRHFDENRYAAAAISGRDGVNTFSFYRILQPGVKLATPLVGTFACQTAGLKNLDFYPISRAWARTEAGGAKFQIFGVATSACLSGIQPPPLMSVDFGINVADQLKYVRDHLIPGHIPVILSDMLPEENDVFAKEFKQNALLFEGGYPWRFAKLPARYPPLRDIGAVRIVSHASPYAAEVVELPASHNCRQARLVATETLYEAPRLSGGQGRGFWASLLGRKSLDALLVRSPFTGTRHLPDVGTSVGARVLLKEIGLPYDDDDIVRTPPLGQEDSWPVPRWMQETRHLRGNPVVYRYHLKFNKRPLANVYRVHHIIVPNLTLVDMLVAVDMEHRLYKTKLIFPPMVTHNELRNEALLERLIGKRWNEITLEDWPERAGAEFAIDNLVRDIQLVLAFDEMYD